MTGIDDFMNRMHEQARADAFLNNLTWEQRRRQVVELEYGGQGESPSDKMYRKLLEGSTEPKYTFVTKPPRCIRCKCTATTYESFVPYCERCAGQRRTEDEKATKNNSNHLPDWMAKWIDSGLSAEDYAKESDDGSSSD
ncbi:MAG: hypothetical protein WCI72_02800 [archaeon]